MTEPPIVIAIRDAYENAHREECERAAAWVENVGWRFSIEQFEEILAERRRLTEADRAKLWQFRGDLIKERSAPIERNLQA